MLMKEENYYYKGPLILIGDVKNEMLRNNFNDYSCNLEYPYRQSLSCDKDVENMRCKFITKRK